MSTDLAFVEAVVDEALDLLEPLGTAITSLDNFDALLLEHGWVPPERSDYLAALKGVVGQFLDIDALATAFEAFTANPGLDAASALLDAVGTALGNLRLPDPAGIAAQLPPPLNTDDFWTAFLRQVGDGLFVGWLRRGVPKVFAIVHLLGLVDIRRIDPAVPGRVPYTRRMVAWEDLGRLISEPDVLLRKTYGWGTAFDAPLLLDRMTIALVALGVPASNRPAPAALLTRFWTPAVPQHTLTAVEVPLVREGQPGDPARLDVSLDLVPVPAKNAPPGPATWTGVALVPIMQGAIELNIPLTASFRLELDAALNALTGPAVEVRPGVPPELTASTTPPNIDLGAAVKGEPRVPFLLLGSRNSHRVELAKLRFGVEVHDPLGTTPELRVGGALDGLTVTIQLAEGDGFLNKILGTKPQSLTVDTGVVWSSRTGLAFTGQAALKLILPVNQKLGPVELQQILLELRANTDAKIRIAGAITAKAALGPIAGAVEEIGVALTLQPDDVSPVLGGMGISWGFLPPKGLSLRIATGPITGGGYLYCDPDAGQYAGAIELSFKVVSLKAIGLLNTKLPDGKPGFSLLIIITVEFTPIALGFGFTLNGVGGLLGINRTMSVDALRAGVKQKTLDAILFPKDPTANAPALIASLKQVFPPAEGRFTFGPMVKIGWGPTSLLEIEVALILELPSPLRLAILGRISVVLPDKKAAIVRLRLDIVGIVDFDRGEISVDASLVDSVLAKFAITGDMALRIGWKANKTFALSAGGFHPKFTPPPGFPTLDRLAISLATGDNPRLRLESYFAVTANTVQFGAKIELYAKLDTVVGTFAASAYASFDAMVQFDPFRFIAELAMGIDLTHNDNPFLHALLRAVVEGPQPWHVLGEIEFDFLGKRHVRAEVTVGEPDDPPPDQITLLPALVQALEAADAWTAELPPGAGQLVTLRAGTTDLKDAVHPLGTMTVRQKLLPLELKIEKFGQAVPIPGTAQAFQITYTALVVDSTIAGRTEGASLLGTTDDFAPGQFLELPDDARLARPAFESMPSGARVGTAIRRWPTAGNAAPAGVAATLDYDTTIVDTAPSGGWEARAATAAPARGLLEDWLLAALVPDGAAAHAASRTEVDRYAGPEQPVGTLPVQHLVAGKDDLHGRTATPTSYAQAVQQLTDDDADQIVTTAEVLAP